MVFINFLMGTITIDIKGMNVEKLISILLKNNIYIRDIVRITYNNFTLKTNCFYIKKMLEQTDKLCYNVNVVKTTGLYGIFTFLKSRIALTITFVLGLMFLVISNFFVWQIKIYGNQTLQSYQICKLLKDNNIRVGASKTSVDVEKIERLIYDNFDEVSLVSATIYGSSVVINIKEKLVVEEMQDFEPLVAKQSGVIQSITLISGTLNCKVGDVVKKGDVLVYPYVVDANGEQKPIIALAQINAYVDVVGKVEFNENQVEYVRTGEYKTVRFYSIFGLEFKLSKFSNTYKNYDLVKDEYYVFNNNLLPIKILSYTYYETKGKESVVDFETVKQQQIELSKELAYKNLPKNIEVLDKQTLISQDQNIYYIVTYLKTIQSIA